MFLNVSRLFCFTICYGREFQSQMVLRGTITSGMKDKVGQEMLFSSYYVYRNKTLICCYTSGGLGHWLFYTSYIVFRCSSI